jgi:hypothetical protein
VEVISGTAMVISGTVVTGKNSDHDFPLRVL